MASTSSQPPSSTPTGWDVFLSFRGEDTRNNFTSHLYFALVDSGIQTFKDEPELRSGDDISDALRLAIQESKAYIVVFSENYASSAWCLSELEEIFNCNQTMGRLVIPVFYNIKPGIVRYQTGTFKQAFEKHESRFAAEMVKDGRNERIKVWFERVKDWRQRVEGWRRSLKQVANKAGKEIDGNKSEAYIIKEIVDELLRKINLNTLKVPKYPVGLHSRVEAITTLLSSDTKGVIKFGIYGMGGVGKTTLAKALFNQLLGGRNFKGSCFLADVRENAKTAKGLVSLQEQLLNDVLNTTKKVEVKNVDQGINYIRERISSAKVLALIDDIYEPEQYENLAGSFASGSVVIITTRDEEMLDKVDVEPKYRYMLKELDDDQSRELFTKYAFEKAEPSNNLLALTEDILRLAGGLPLALQVFGSHLSTKKEVGWKSYIANLQKYPNSTIEEKLVISLDALELDDRVLKKIFIDIACFFIGWEKEGAVEVLETYYSYTDDKMDILKKRCLLTVNDRNILEMHDLLRDVGRNVARNNAPDEPGKHSRLWLPKDIGDVLKNHNGTEVIEGIIPYNIYDKDVVQEDSSSSSCDICHKHVFKGESFTTETFKWMSKLRYLYLSNVNLTGSFEHIFEDLRVFYWDRCPLKCLPSDFCPKKLVILELPSSNMRTMWDLNMVSHAFGKLKTLNMSGSYNLTETPDFTKLPCLETLNLQFCPSLEEVHISIGSLGRLVSLNLLDCKKLRSLPDSICSLRALEVLNISQCSSLEALPIQLGNIESLTKLDARVLPVSELPDSIGHLTKLVELDLSCNQKLETLPDTICNLRSLKVLNIFYCGLDAFPTAIANIESLTKLNASCLTVSKLPDSIGSLTKLVELDLSYNKKLETLPDTICNLRSLEVLNINGCLELERLPDQLWKLTRLRELDACGDTRLRRLPDIEPSQIALSLQELRLNSRDITALPSGFTQLSNLQILDLNHCRSLLSIPKLPPSLESIRAKECSSLERLPDLSNLKQLEELDLDGCRKLTDIPSFPPNLKTIRANRCSSLERLPDLSNLKQLEGLHLDYCRKLTDIPSFPPNLKTIWAYDCSSLERLPDLSNLKQLKVLVLDYCRKLTDIASFPPNLKTIWANGCSSLERLPDLSNLKQLEELDLYGCENLTDIQGLEQLTALKFNLTNLEKFNLRKQLSGNEDVIIIFSCAKVNKYEGNVYLTNYPATRIYINPTHYSVNELKKKMLEYPHLEICSPPQEETKEILTVAEIKMLKEDFIQKYVCCNVTVKKMDEKMPWYYNKCTGCDKELNLDGGKYECGDCKRLIPWPDRRFKVYTLCSDKTGSIAIIFNDSAIQMITDKSVLDIQSECSEEMEEIFPPILKQIINQKYTITLLLTEDNIKNGSMVYAAKEIVQEVEQCGNFSPSKDKLKGIQQEKITMEMKTDNEKTETPNTAISTNKSKTRKVVHPITFDPEEHLPLKQFKNLKNEPKLKDM